MTTNGGYKCLVKIPWLMDTKALDIKTNFSKANVSVLFKKYYRINTEVKKK